MDCPSLGGGYRGTLAGPLSLEVACGMEVWMPVPMIRCWLPATGGGPDPRCVRDAVEVLGALYIAMKTVRVRLWARDFVLDRILSDKKRTTSDYWD